VVISFILGLQLRDGQGGRVGGAVFGSRESVWNPNGSFIILVDEHLGGTSCVLLVPRCIVVVDAATVEGTGDAYCLTRIP
jgi:hypothetical protein